MKRVSNAALNSFKMVDRISSRNQENEIKETLASECHIVSNGEPENGKNMNH